MTQITKTRRALGKGLDALLPPTPSQTSQSLKEIGLDKIVPGRTQPRTIFDEDEITNLSASISEHGIIQPLVVTPIADGKYELIAGERRYRAAQRAGFTKAPVVIKNVDPEEMLVMSLVENIQRQDLTAIEEARAFKSLLENFSQTHDDVAKKVGKSRTTITNALRLLDLPSSIQEDIIMGRYSAGHARALLSVADEREREKLRQKLIAGISVREAEEEAKKKKGKATKASSFDVDPLTDELRCALGTKVNIVRKSNGRGKITVEFYSDEDLNRISALLLQSYKGQG